MSGLSDDRPADTQPPVSPPRFASGSLETNKLAPFNPTDASAQEAALSFLTISGEDVLYDLGCGDARFLVAAHLSMPSGSAMASVGVEYDKVYYDRAVAACSPFPRICIQHADVVTVDMSDATAVFVYLVPDGLKLITDKLYAVLRRGGRIASYMFSVPGLTPVQTILTKGGCKVQGYDKSSLPE